MASQQQFHDLAFLQTSPELHLSQQPAYQEPKNHDMVYDMIIKFTDQEHLNILFFTSFNIYLLNQSNNQNSKSLRNLQQQKYCYIRCICVKL